MHAILPRKDLYALAKAASSVASPSDVRPVLRNVLLTASQTGVSLSATNLTVSLWLNITTDAGAQVLQEGSVLVPARNLISVLNTLSSDTVELKEDDGKLEVKAGRAEFEIVTEDPNDFPKIPRFSSRVDHATVTAAHLKSLISRVAFCAHTERSHYNMHGVLVKTDGSLLKLVATNGQRLAVADAPVLSKSSDELDKSLVVPAAAVPLLTKIAGDDDTVDIQWMGRGINVRGPRGEASLLALNGGFPPYQRGVPKNSKKLELSRQKLLGVLRQANALWSTSTSFVDLTLVDGKLTFNSIVQDSGEANVECDGDWEHDPLTIVINPDFLIKSANAMSGETVILEVEGVNVPTVLREKNDDSVESFCVFAVARK